MKQDFLHRHYHMETKLKVPKDHVIVDREDWKIARSLPDASFSIEFSEWVAANYIRLSNTWIGNYDQGHYKQNHFTTKELLNRFTSIRRAKLANSLALQ